MSKDKAVRVKKGLKDKGKGYDSMIGLRRVSRIRVKDRVQKGKGYGWN